MFIYYYESLSFFRKKAKEAWRSSVKIANTFKKLQEIYTFNTHKYQILVNDKEADWFFRDLLLTYEQVVWPSFYILQNHL